MKYLTILALILSFAACKSTKKVEQVVNLQSEHSINTDIAQDTAIISMTKGGCYGRCPSYDFSITQHGLMTFKSKRFCKKEGVFNKQLNDLETKELFAKFKAADLFSMEDNYESMIPDMPMITISYNDGKKEKTVRGKLERPESLKALQKELESYAQTTEGWDLVGQTEMQQQAQFNFGELIVELKEKVLVPKWIKGYGTYDLALIKQVAPNRNLYLLKYDQRKANPDVIKAALEKDDSVISVSFNKRTQPRDH